MAWSGSSGTVQQRIDYDPFGGVLAKDGALIGGAEVPFGFSTKYQDAATGLCYYGFRYYETNTGRWVSRDPIGERGGINLYAFVRNDGINHIDYLGQKLKKVCTISIVGGHLRQIQREQDNWRKQQRHRRNSGDLLQPVCCFANEEGRFTWPDPESRAKHPAGNPGDPLMEDEMARRIVFAENLAPSMCGKKPACCEVIRIVTRLLDSKSMQRALRRDKMKRVRDYRNEYDCETKKWSKPKFK